MIGRFALPRKSFADGGGGEPFPCGDGFLRGGEVPPCAEEDRVNRDGEGEQRIKGEAALAQGELDGLDQKIKL